MRALFTKFLDIFFLLRIPLLAPVWTIVILGWITGNKSAHIGGGWLTGPDLKSHWLALGGFSLIVASIYVVNQIVDIESDRINHKLFLLPQGLVSIPAAWTLSIICAASGMAISFLYDYVIVAIFAAGLIIGVLYNLPPFTLKNRALGGVLANAFGHGMVTFLLGWYLSKYGSQISSGVMWGGLISSISPALANGAVFLATTIPDASGDRLTGKKTFCVRYGEKITAVSAAILCFLALFFSFFMEYNFWVMAFPTAISLFFFILFAVSTKKEIAFKAFKWPVFLLSATVAFFVPVYGVLILITFAGSRVYYQWRFGIEYPTFKSK